MRIKERYEAYLAECAKTDGDRHGAILREMTEREAELYRAWRQAIEDCNTWHEQTKREYLKEKFGIENIYPVLYLRYDNGNYYVGQTDSIAFRYGWSRLKTIVAIKELDTYNKREMFEIEREAIEFCLAFGLSLSNKVIKPVSDLEYLYL